MRAVRFEDPPTAMQLVQWATGSGIHVLVLKVLTPETLALRLDEDEQDGAPDDLSDLAHTPLSDCDSSNTASMGQSTDG